MSVDRVGWFDLHNLIHWGYLDASFAHLEVFLYQVYQLLLLGMQLPIIFFILHLISMLRIKLALLNILDEFMEDNLILNCQLNLQGWGTWRGIALVTRILKLWYLPLTLGLAMMCRREEPLLLLHQHRKSLPYLLLWPLYWSLPFHLYLSPLTSQTQSQFQEVKILVKGPWLSILLSTKEPRYLGVQVVHPSMTTRLHITLLYILRIQFLGNLLPMNLLVVVHVLPIINIKNISSY